MRDKQNFGICINSCNPTHMWKMPLEHDFDSWKKLCFQISWTIGLEATKRGPVSCWHSIGLTCMLWWHIFLSCGRTGCVENEFQATVLVSRPSGEMRCTLSPLTTPGSILTSSYAQPLSGPTLIPLRKAQNLACILISFSLRNQPATHHPPLRTLHSVRNNLMN
jgi:hypothetical protein